MRTINTLEIAHRSVVRTQFARVLLDHFGIPGRPVFNRHGQIDYFVYGPSKDGTTVKVNYSEHTAKITSYIVKPSMKLNDLQNKLQAANNLMEEYA